MVVVAIKIALLYYIIQIVDMYMLSWQCLTRPIVIAPLAGLILGDFKTGIIMGAALESIFMGISAIGGSLPADATTASIIAVSFTILTGASIEEGVSLSLPIGTLMASFAGLLTPIFAGLAPYWEKLAASGNTKKFTVMNAIVCALSPLINAVVLFLAVAYGVEGLNAVLMSLPSWVLTALGAAASMMLAIGFAILTSMIWSKETGVFFFVGYVLVRYLNVAILPIAIIGIAIAVTSFFSEKKFIDFKNSMKKANATVADDEEDFF